MPSQDPIVVGDVIEVKLIGYVASDAFENVLHYKCTSASGSNILTQLSDFCAAFAGSFVSAYGNALADEAKLTGLRVVRLTNGGSPVAFRALLQSGAITEDYLPVNRSVVFRKQSFFGGRKGFGHFYLPAPVESMCHGDYVDPSDARLIAMKTTLQASVTYTGFVWDSVITDKTGAAPLKVEAIYINALVGSQRRRVSRILAAP